MRLKNKLKDNSCFNFEEVYKNEDQIYKKRY